MQTLDKWSSFRGWVHNLWLENCEEHQQYGGELLSREHYWHRYRWWLRRQYRAEQQKEQQKARWRL